jgi:polyisoprenoid-binding protein YceI
MKIAFMKSRIKSGILSVILVITIMLPVAGQKVAMLIPSESKVTISGTSNLHEWEEKVKTFDVTMLFQPQGADITSISKVSFVSKSASVVSENSIMTGKTHDALQVEKHPDIVFRSSEASILDLQGNNLKGSVSGDLILNGVTKRIVISFTGVLSGDRMEISGTQLLNMTDFGIKPPTAMFGTLKTGDKVEVTFLLKFRLGQ